jgi:hypothetical protein
LFDQGQRRLTQLGEFRERDLGYAETLSFHKRRVGLHVLVERIFFVEFRK